THSHVVAIFLVCMLFFFSSRRRHTRSTRDWSSDVCSSDLYDLSALLGAVTKKTKLVYVCNPNNPTGKMTTRAELDAYFERVPEHVLTVVDQAYFEYIDDPDYPDAIAEHFARGRRVLVLRTFSKIYGLAGLRVGFGVGPAEIITA